MALLESMGFLPAITRPASAALSKALFIASCQFALYLAVVTRIGSVQLPLTIDFPTFYYAALVYRAGGNPYTSRSSENGQRVSELTSTF